MKLTVEESGYMYSNGYSVARRLIAPKGLLCRRVQKSMFVCPSASDVTKSADRLEMCALAKEHRRLGSRDWLPPVLARKYFLKNFFGMKKYYFSSRFFFVARYDHTLGITHAYSIQFCKRFAMAKFS